MTLELFREDGYINATKLCQDGGKLFGDWKRNSSTNSQILLLSEELNIPVDTLVQIKKGGNVSKVKTGTWIHPRLGTVLAQWISPTFGLKVSKWVEQWRQTNAENEGEYKESISTITPEDDKVYRERVIRDKLALEYSGEVEVETKFGKIDVLTPTMIIEVKTARSWKHALGQILAYSEEYKSHKKVICLFDLDKCMYSVKDIREVYSKYGVELLVQE
jgi:KilA-N domain